MAKVLVEVDLEGAVVNTEYSFENVRFFKIVLSLCWTAQVLVGREKLIFLTVKKIDSW